MASALIFTTVDVVYLQSKLSSASTYTTLLPHLWPVDSANSTDSWVNANNKAIHALMTCMTANTCRENQTSVVLASSYHLDNAKSGYISGEDTW